MICYFKRARFIICVFRNCKICRISSRPPPTPPPQKSNERIYSSRNLTGRQNYIDVADSVVTLGWKGGGPGDARSQGVGERLEGRRRIGRRLDSERLARRSSDLGGPPTPRQFPQAEVRQQLRWVDEFLSLSSVLSHRNRVRLSITLRQLTSHVDSDDDDRGAVFRKCERNTREYFSHK